MLAMRFMAAIRVLRGVETMTAPAVPPSTIIAAVNCETSLILPPSTTNPPSKPPRATTIPPSVARSGTGAVFRFFRFGRLSHDPLRQTASDLAAKFDHLQNHLARSLEHDELLPVHEADHRVRRCFDVLDLIRVQHQWNVVDPRQMDHGAPILCAYRPGVTEFEENAGHGRRGRALLEHVDDFAQFFTDSLEQRGSSPEEIALRFSRLL